MIKKIVIADDEPITRMDMREMLEEEGYNVVAEASDGFDAIELAKKHSPDLIIMDIKMPLLDGLSAAKIILKEELAGEVILLSAYNDKTFIEKAKEAGVIGYLVKPIDNKSLITTIEVSLSRCKEFKEVKKNVKVLEKKLESRKIIEKAKGKIMQKLNISEEDAYTHIRNISMKKRVSMEAVAQIIIMSEGEI
ncbi:Fis family transcriptional regulator [Clostridium tetani]|uniref:Stage 0 sporulation protein A homolog n=2 Tax=Clostridium tetani TaxID=1513 RepID=Q892C6_CLOTE|nr:response regulator [Clostridium tetani]AAO36669.1 ethanolamine utilization response regulator [Clostridium tetani E88]AVP54038.1 ANTAR domain-containing protein [Clostridium tetani]KGI39321.1 Fis family transcriptional regulator [Clostridium tetani ATCC 9441]KGI41057.1 Fis family transcriptional regulator [Clostridium tetani]KGI45256.1 Fis family transcriptional regulator [Clostridium tetani]